MVAIDFRISSSALLGQEPDASVGQRKLCAARMLATHREVIELDAVHVAIQPLIDGVFEHLTFL